MEIKMKDNMKWKKSMGIFLPLLLIITLVMGNTVLLPGTSAAPTTANKAAEKDKDKKKEAAKKEPVLHYEVTVTATRTKKDTFEIPKPVSVINRQKLEEKAPNNITEMLIELPGVDVNGVGANQSRPVIRGFRGQRILLMEDGIRMNNSRRQQDFGEIPALVDVSGVDRVEVVRGPASVLYGSDAIGGVVNIITRIPSYRPGSSSIHGSLGYRYSSADKQNKGMADISGNIGKFGFMLSGNYRDAHDYTAPAGTFGNIHLPDEVTVTDTGVTDGGVNLLLNYNFSEQNQVSFKYQYYHATDAGFGFIEPELYNAGSTRIQIRYPWQTFNKYTFKYENRRLGFALADHVNLTGYHSSNERELAMDIFASFGIPNMPQVGARSQSENYTDVDTVGFRLEFNKAVKSHVFTYGVDLFQDNTANTDTNTTQVVGFGPPRPSINTITMVPNARYRSFGVFLQDDMPLFKRTSLILGLRYQNVNARTEGTPGLEDRPLVDSTDQTLVGTANLIYGITDQLRLVFSVGRGFRSPNLIERFYHGPAPEGSGFQGNNTGLDAETSLNFDIGFKYRWKNIYLESSYFNNVVREGIRLNLTGKLVKDMKEMGIPEYQNLPDEYQNLAVYQNINVDKLRMQGVEVLGKLYLNFGLSLMANFTYIKSKDLGRPETPYVDTYSAKFNFNVRYDDPGKRFWFGYDVRINGNQKDVILVNNPVGDIIPGFTVHSVSAGITLFKNSGFPQRIGIIIYNLTDTLYSEFSNASFFRPAPKRQIVLTWSTGF
jgi:outer membrane receptor protein involved in Fe transport